MSGFISIDILALIVTIWESVKHKYPHSKRKAAKIALTGLILGIKKEEIDISILPLTLAVYGNFTNEHAKGLMDDLLEFINDPQF